MQLPKIGVGIIILNDHNEVLIGKRKGSHSPYYSIPGGHLEYGETFEMAAQREAYEETGLKIDKLKVICITNNLRTYKEEGHHSVSICLLAESYEGTPQLKEPHKCEEWAWHSLTLLPQPHFDASEFGIECYLKNQFYIKNQGNIQARR